MADSFTPSVGPRLASSSQLLSFMRKGDNEASWKTVNRSCDPRHDRGHERDSPRRECGNRCRRTDRCPGVPANPDDDDCPAARLNNATPGRWRIARPAQTGEDLGGAVVTDPNDADSAACFARRGSERLTRRLHRAAPCLALLADHHPSEKFCKAADRRDITITAPLPYCLARNTTSVGPVLRPRVQVQRSALHERRPKNSEPLLIRPGAYMYIQSPTHRFLIWH